MKIIRSELLGFCMGVRRALEITENTTGNGIYTLGPLIHNKRVLEDLDKRGIKTLNDNEFNKSPPTNSTVIIRAHGIPPLLEESLKKKGNKVMDATCPNVKANQKTARELSNKNFYVFLAGEKNHGEIIGIRAYIDENLCIICANPDEAEIAARDLYNSDKNAKTALMAQTTISHDEFNAIGKKILNFFPELKIRDTICNATERRLEALRKLCAKTDAVIVIGGQDSANTRRLFYLAKELGKETWLIESASDLPADIADYETIGLCAGASTPDFLIREIEEQLAIQYNISLR